MLVIFSGLPGSGKTTISQLVCQQLGAVYLRADTIEQGLRESGFRDEQIGAAGYVLAYRVATENLRLGLSVVADTVNPWQLTRDAWRAAALAAKAGYLDVEVVCSDPVEHRRRVESRSADISGFKLPTWREVLDREYHPWEVEPLQVDTSVLCVEEAVALIVTTVDDLRSAS